MVLHGAAAGGLLTLLTLLPLHSLPSLGSALSGVEGGTATPDTPGAPGAHGGGDDDCNGCLSKGADDADDAGDADDGVCGGGVRCVCVVCGGVCCAVAGVGRRPGESTGGDDDGDDDDDDDDARSGLLGCGDALGDIKGGDRVGVERTNLRSEWFTFFCGGTGELDLGAILEEMALNVWILGGAVGLFAIFFLFQNFLEV